MHDIARVAGSAILGACLGFITGGFIGSILSFVLIPRVMPAPQPCD